MVAMPFPADRPWNIDDLESMPDDGQRYELLQGELIVSPSPGRSHQRILQHLLIQMEAVAHRTGSGEVVIGPIDVHFSPHDLVQPDILYISDRQADQYKETHFAGAPAFVIEIISPYTSGFYERVRKTALYMSRGVEEYWVIDPEKQCILVFTSASPDTTSEIFTSGMLAANVLAGLTIDIPKLFAAADQPRKTEN